MKNAYHSMLPFSAGAFPMPGGQGMLSKHFLIANFTPPPNFLMHS
jgi:hypothetical protein